MATAQVDDMAALWGSCLPKIANNKCAQQKYGLQRFHCNATVLQLYLHIYYLQCNNGTKVGIVGMGHVGNAVCHNLLRKGYTVTAITDIKPDNCKGFPESIAVKGTAREVAELSDIVVSGNLIQEQGGFQLEFVSISRVLNHMTML